MWQAEVPWTQCNCIRLYQLWVQHRVLLSINSWYNSVKTSQHSSAAGQSVFKENKDDNSGETVAWNTIKYSLGNSGCFYPQEHLLTLVLGSSNPFCLQCKTSPVFPAASILHCHSRVLVASPRSFKPVNGFQDNRHSSPCLSKFFRKTNT